jgi:hypothetical protein
MNGNGINADAWIDRLENVKGLIETCDDLIPIRVNLRDVQELLLVFRSVKEYEEKTKKGANNEQEERRNKRKTD